MESQTFKKGERRQRTFSLLHVLSDVRPNEGCIEGLNVEGLGQLDFSDLLQATDQVGAIFLGKIT